VVLGESVLVTGATFTNLTCTGSAERGSEIISTSPTPGRLGRSAYRYWHRPMVAGIIVTAVGDELVTAHPGGHPTTATALTVLGGPALFIAGHALFKHTMFGHFSIQRVATVALLLALIPVGLKRCSASRGGTSAVCRERRGRPRRDAQPDRITRSPRAEH
jgi:low temperature requirement protein LtrA